MRETLWVVGVVCQSILDMIYLNGLFFLEELDEYVVLLALWFLDMAALSKSFRD